LKKNTKGKAFVIIFIGLIILQAISMLDFGLAKETADEDDLTMDIWGSFSTSSTEIVGSGETMGLGTYNPDTPNLWFEEPSATNSDFEFSNMQMNFAEIHSPIYERSDEANFTKGNFHRNYTINSTKISEFSIASGEVATYVLDAHYNYSYGVDNVSSYDTEIGSDNSVSVDKLETSFDEALNIETTGVFQFYADIYGITYSYGSVGAGAISDLRLDDGNNLRIDAERNTYTRYAGSDSYVLEEGAYDEYIKDSNDWADNSDEDSILLKMIDPMTQIAECQGSLYCAIDVPDHEDWSDMEIHYTWDSDSDLLAGGIHTRWTKFYIRKSDGMWEKIDEQTSTSEHDGVFIIDASDIDDYTYHGDFRFCLDGRLRSDLYYDYIAWEIELDRVELKARYDYKIEAYIDYPNVADGYRLYYDVTADYSSTPDESFLEIGGSVALLSDGPNTGFIDSSGSGVRLALKYDGDNNCKFYVDYLLCYDREDQFEIESILEFDYSNKTSIDNIYNVSLRYYTDATFELFMLQYGTESSGWTDVGYLDGTSYTNLEFQATHPNPNLRIIGSESAYSHEDVDKYTVFFDCINLTSKYEPFLNIWANHSYEIALTTYNELDLCSFGSNYNYDWNIGNVSYIFDSYMFDNYDSETTITSILQYINYTFQIAFKMNISVNFTVKISSVEWRSSSDIDFSLNGEDILPLSPNKACISLYDFPSQLVFQASEDIRFNMSTETEFYFSSELEILSRSHLQTSITLTSDHCIDIDRLRFDSDLEIYAVYLQGSTTPFIPTSNNTVDVNFELEPDENLVIDVYLEMYEDIYQELEYFFDYLGNGVFYTYLQGTANIYTFVDKTKNYDWRLNMPVGFELADMSLLFSNMRYLPDYTSDPTNNTYDYGYYSPQYRGDVVSWYRDYYQTNKNFTKVADVGGSGNEIVYSEDFASETGEMIHNYNPDDYNSTYSVNDHLAMQNTFPQEIWNEYYFDGWNLNYNSEYVNANSTDVFNSLITSYDIGLSGNNHPHGIEFVDNYFYITDDYFDEYVYKYDSNFNSLITYNIGALGGNSHPGGIVFFDNYFYITDVVTEKVYKYDSNFNSLITSYNLDALNNDPFGIEFVDNYFYIIDIVTEKVYKYDSNFNSLITSYDLSALGGNDDPMGMVFSDNYFYIASESYVHKYDSNFNSLITSYDLSALGGNDDPMGMVFVDGYGFIIDCYDDYVYKYHVNMTLSSSLNTYSLSSVADTSNSEIINGTIDTNGDLETIDSDYSIFNSTSTIVGHIPATYSFIDDQVPNVDINGTYSFEGDANGVNPAGWTLEETGGTVNVISDLDNHNKVLEIDQNSDYNLLANQHFSNQSYGTIEFWINIDNSHEKTYFNIENNGIIVLFFYFTLNNELYVRYGGSEHYITDFNEHQWYHYRVDFDCNTSGYNSLSDDSFNLYIDGVLKCDNLPLTDITQNFVNAIEFRIAYYRITGTAKYYIDAVGYSWDSNYDIGDNLYPLGWHTSEAGGTVSVISDLDNHNKVVELSDTDGGNNVIMHKTISQTYGTIEFWMRTNEAGKDSLFRLKGVGNNVIILKIDADKFQYYDGAWHDVGLGASDNTWYHIRIDFEGTAGGYSGLAQYDWKVFINGVEYGDYNYASNQGTLDLIEFYTNVAESNYIMYVDAVGFSWDVDYDIGDNLNTIPAKLNFTLPIKITSENRTIDDLSLFYSYITDIYQTINLSIYNFTNANWIQINSSMNNKTFYNLFKNDFNLTNILNATNYLILKFEAKNYSISKFQLYIDKLKINFNATQTSGDIYADLIKTIDFSFLNRYDTGYDIYQKLYNITIEFQYRYSNYTAYDEYAYFNLTNLIKDEAWHTFSYNFTYDSDSLDSFDLMFNISNGLLEIKNMNYSIIFECLNQFGGNEIYQYFKLSPVFSLDFLQESRGEWYLNYTLNFTASSDYLYYNFTNTINNSLLLYRLWIEHESGWGNYYNYNSNSSFNTEFSLNITQILLDNGKTNFKDFYIELYLAGNPSNCTLDDIILFDYDSDFNDVISCWIDDSIIVSTQNISIYWKAVDRYISHVEINQTYETNNQVLHNTTLTNNTLNSFNFFNVSNGVYYLNATFYDLYGNYERWSINYTIIAGISMAISYQNPLFINTNNTISVDIMSESTVIHVYYDNSTHYIHEYNNGTYPIYNYNFNFTILKATEEIYNISVKSINQFNDTFYVNISYICAIERTTSLDIHNLKNSYEQDDTLNITISLRDMYNLPIANKNVNYTIEAPNGTIIFNTTDITDINGEFDINKALGYHWRQGWYHLNVSFNDTVGEYMGCWKMMSFEITPILRIINDSSFVCLTVRNISIGSDNNISIGSIAANSFDLLINNTGTLTFDLYIYNVILNRSSTENYTSYLTWEFELEQSNSIFNRINFTVANISDIPKNFTYYYFDNVESSDYTLLGDNIQINDLIGEIYNNGESFEIQLRYIQNQQTKIQLTETPRTDSDSVLHNQKFLADDDYKFWYFKTTHTINSIVEFEHLRTGELIDYDDFIIEENKYKFFLGTVRNSNKTAVNDIFNATIDYNPNWNVDYEINENNGTFAEITIQYSADFNVNNVILVLDLSGDDNLYMEEWSNNIIQSLNTFKLELPSVNFTTSVQSITITGISDTPITDFDRYKNEDKFEISDEDYNDLNEYFEAYLDFYKYSQIWIVGNIDNDWKLDGIHYNNKDIDINSDYLFTCSGYGTSITSAYLRIKTNPISSWNRIQTDSYVRYTIDCNLPCKNIDFKFYIASTQRVQITGVELDTEYLDLIEYYSAEDKDYFKFLRLDLEEGVNVIKIKYKVLSLSEAAWLLLAAAAAIIGLVIMYYETKDGEFINKIKFWKKKC